RPRAGRRRRRRAGTRRRSPASGARTRRGSRRSVARAQDGEERLLRDLDLADHLHALLAGLLLLQELALARDVAAVALGDDVLAQRLDRLARDDLPADRGLDRNVELLARDEPTELR